MKKIIFLFCFITLFACSKSEDVSLVPDNSIEVSHITNDDLALVDGSILLTISKEEAVKRGVPASEYDLVEETLIKHNKAEWKPSPLITYLRGEYFFIRKETWKSSLTMRIRRRTILLKPIA